MSGPARVVTKEVEGGWVDLAICPGPSADVLVCIMAWLDKKSILSYRAVCKTMTLVVEDDGIIRALLEHARAVAFQRLFTPEEVAAHRTEQALLFTISRLGAKGSKEAAAKSFSFSVTTFCLAAVGAGVGGVLTLGRMAAERFAKKEYETLRMTETCAYNAAGGLLVVSAGAAVVGLVGEEIKVEFDRQAVRSVVSIWVGPERGPPSRGQGYLYVVGSTVVERYDVVRGVCEVFPAKAFGLERSCAKYVLPAAMSLSS